MKKKTRISEEDLNNFAIENRLGNIDGFISFDEDRVASLREGRTNNRATNYLKENQLPDRYRNQASKLEEYELLFLELKDKLKPNSKTLINLKAEINTLKESLKRPNEVLVEFRTKKNIASRDYGILQNIEDNLELIKLKKINAPDPWELISIPTINSGRIAPRRKQIALISLLSSFLLANLIAIYREREKGIIFDKDYIKRELSCLLLDDIYPSQIELGLKQFKKIISNYEKKEKRICIIHASNDENGYLNSIIKLFRDNLKIISFDLKEIERISDYNCVFIFIEPGNINETEIIILNQYIKLFNEKFIGWININNKKLKLK